MELEGWSLPTYEQLLQALLELAASTAQELDVAPVEGQMPLLDHLLAPESPAAVDLSMNAHNVSSLISIILGNARLCSDERP
jgi:hypothetical protein